MRKAKQSWTIIIVFAALLVGSATVLAGAIPLGPNVLVTDAGLADNSAHRPDLAVLGETVYAVWEDERDDDAYG
ncbi:MAG: hypothetical protein M3Q45_05655, partial [Chloroflexota bacterium]|nr:hypothetical protein [Chloroflexota bacterium]